MKNSLNQLRRLSRRMSHPPNSDSYKALQIPIRIQPQLPGTIRNDAGIQTGANIIPNPVISPSSQNNIEERARVDHNLSNSPQIPSSIPPQMQTQNMNFRMNQPAPVFHNSGHGMTQYQPTFNARLNAYDGVPIPPVLRPYHLHDNNNKNDDRKPPLIRRIYFSRQRDLAPVDNNDMQNCSNNANDVNNEHKSTNSNSDDASQIEYLCSLENSPSIQFCEWISQSQLLTAPNGLQKLKQFNDSNFQDRYIKATASTPKNNPLSNIEIICQSINSYLFRFSFGEYNIFCWDNPTNAFYTNLIRDFNEHQKVQRKPLTMTNGVQFILDAVRRQSGLIFCGDKNDIVEFLSIYTDKAMVVVQDSDFSWWCEKFEDKQLTYVGYHGDSFSRGISRQFQITNQLILLLTTYSALISDYNYLKELEFGLIIADNAERLKNPEGRKRTVLNIINSKVKLALSNNLIQSQLESIQNFVKNHELIYLPPIHNSKYLFIRPTDYQLALLASRHFESQKICQNGVLIDQSCKDLLKYSAKFVFLAKIARNVKTKTKIIFKNNKLLHLFEKYLQDEDIPYRSPTDKHTDALISLYHLNNHNTDTNYHGITNDAHQNNHTSDNYTANDTIKNTNTIKSSDDIENNDNIERNDIEKADDIENNDDIQNNDTIQNDDNMENSNAENTNPNTNDSIENNSIIEDKKNMHDFIFAVDCAYVDSYRLVLYGTREHYFLSKYSIEHNIQNADVNIIPAPPLISFEFPEMEIDEIIKTSSSFVETAAFNFQPLGISEFLEEHHLLAIIADIVRNGFKYEQHIYHATIYALYRAVKPEDIVLFPLSISKLTRDIPNFDVSILFCGSQKNWLHPIQAQIHIDYTPFKSMKEYFFRAAKKILMRIENRLVAVSYSLFYPNFQFDQLPPSYDSTLEEDQLIFHQIQNGIECLNVKRAKFMINLMKTDLVSRNFEDRYIFNFWTRHEVKAVIKEYVNFGGITRVTKTAILSKIGDDVQKLTIEIANRFTNHSPICIAVSIPPPLQGIGIPASIGFDEEEMRQYELWLNISKSILGLFETPHFQDSNLQLFQKILEFGVSNLKELLLADFMPFHDRLTKADIAFLTEKYPLEDQDNLNSAIPEYFTTESNLLQYLQKLLKENPQMTLPKVIVTTPQISTPQTQAPPQPIVQQQLQSQQQPLSQQQQNTQPVQPSIPQQQNQQQQQPSSGQQMQSLSSRNYSPPNDLLQRAANLQNMKRHEKKMKPSKQPPPPPPPPQVPMPQRKPFPISHKEEKKKEQDMINAPQQYYMPRSDLSRRAAELDRQAHQSKDKTHMHIPPQPIKQPVPQPQSIPIAQVNQVHQSQPTPMQMQSMQPIPTPTTLPSNLTPLKKRPITTPVQQQPPLVMPQQQQITQSNVVEPHKATHARFSQAAARQMMNEDFLKSLPHRPRASHQQQAQPPMPQQGQQSTNQQQAVKQQPPINQFQQQQQQIFNRTGNDYQVPQPSYTTDVSLLPPKKKPIMKPPGK
ncbi:hypothetical protein TRFO_18163 [Tritrichomonas foetus]|uniref:SNF2 N-terminal domain-containing protein n=1 Tax=Tritrichomonas foetus TaxID=1144522 RepID=A0A1J4KLI2_9EUKA|nr:hypothetical protein TRFO_18163 [Tritrichomonas foetus]|eukprot:OHT12167.1 hypothetical protein TRFO_18163 [Tritrichomonas foetus]